MKKIITILIFFVHITSMFSQNQHVEGYLQKGERKADKPFLKRYENSLRGDITFAANSILNRNPPLTPYHGNRNNTDFSMRYIDVDSDNSTFSSSMSRLNLPNCSKVVYAGLYWAGVYPYDNWNQESAGVNTRDNNFNKMKFKVPGGNYINLTADKTNVNTRELIYDDGIATEKPYVCYKDVTNILQSLGTNVSGDYFGANIKATLGTDNVGSRLGSSAGWVLVVIYENETKSSKKFFVFDGFSTIKRANGSNPANSLEVPFSGFNTIPVGQVEVSILAAALEGDKGIPNDNFQIKKVNGGFESLTTGDKNPKANFFNGSITKFNRYLTSNLPNSKNTLGFDVDLFKLNNRNNTIIDNNQKNGVLRFKTTGDTYWPFLNALAIQILEPKIQLVKTIEDDQGNDISGTPVNLGSELYYKINFKNIGTDSSKETKIIDILPKNVNLIEENLILPNSPTTGDPIAYDYDPPRNGNGFRGRLTFHIPDNMVEVGDQSYDIRIKVQVVTDCHQLRDMCSNIIENQAFANYERVESAIAGNDKYNKFDNEPSFAGIDECDFGIVGTSNFLVDVDGCSFERTQVICGNSTELTAGDGFASYSWKNASGTTIGTTKTVSVTTAGVYTVTKTVSVSVPNGCISSTEVVNVVENGSEPNPLESFADQIVVCPDNNDKLAEIYLCGNGSKRKISLPFTSSTGTTVEWFKLDETSCFNPPPASFNSRCPKKDTGCVWDSIGTEYEMDFTDAGEYRLRVEYDGQCPQTYYFNIFEGSLNPNIDKKDILCGVNGAITIRSVPPNYQYTLTGPNGYNAPYQVNNSFTDLTNPGDYYLTIKNNDPTAASCEYSFPAITIEEKNIGINIIESSIKCKGDNADIRVQASGVYGDYTFKLEKNSGLIGSEGPTPNDEHTFTVNEGGLYTVTLTTEQCSITETINIVEPGLLNLSAIKIKDITCKDGSSPAIIELTASGGTIDTSSGNTYNFAVWTSQGTDLYTSPSDIPSEAYLSPNINPNSYSVPIGNQGEYRFIVVDQNLCYSISQPITVNVEQEVAFITTETPVSCIGSADGTATILVDGDNQGYSFEYSVNNSNWSDSNIVTGLSQGTHTIYIRATKSTYQCTYEVEVEIQNPIPITGGSATATDLSCDTSGNTINGVITFTAPTGGTGTYNYYFKLESDTDYTLVTSGTQQTNLGAGTYNIRVEDTNNCSVNLANVTINSLPNAPTLSRTLTYNCEGEGTITVSPFDASYTYSLNNGTPQAGADANVFKDLVPGAYTISVIYGSSCAIEIPVTIDEDKEFSGSIIEVLDSECYGSDNGKITIGANNVIGDNFEYSIDGGTTWSTSSDNPYPVVGLAAGNYNVQIKETKDGVECIEDLGNVTITQPDELTLSASVTTNISCNEPEATITAVASGGIPPYEFSIDNGNTWQEDPIFTNVAAGNFIVMIRDSRLCTECGCTANLFENGGFEEPTESQTRHHLKNEDLIPGWDTTDSSNDIEIWYNNFNGVPPYEGVAFAELNARFPGSLYQEYCTQPGDIILWSVAHRGRVGVDVASISIGNDLATATIVETMTDGTDAWGVYSGTYIVPANQPTTVIAFDAVSTATGSLSIGNFIDDVQITIQQNNCVPVEVTIEDPITLDFSVTPETCYAGNNGDLTVDIISGNDDYQFSIDGGTTWQTPEPATPNQYVFDNLTPGTYSVTVKDGLGCTIPAKDGTINPQINATINSVNASCNDGEIAITPSGGDGNYVFVVENTVTNVSNTYTTSPITVSAGNYNVFVRDQGGNTGYCQYTESVNITQVTSPTVSTSAEQPKCTGDGGTIDVVVSDGTADYIITLTDATNAQVDQVTSTNGQHSFTGLVDGTYTVSVTDAYGCDTGTASETIATPAALVAGTTTATDFECNATGVTAGTITFSGISGGTTPYTYFYKLTTDTNYTPITGSSVADVAAGTYNTRIIDANDCVLDLNDVTINDVPATPTLSSGVTYNCDGTGNITVTPNPAVATAGNTYMYSLNGGTAQASNVFNNVAVGGHTISLAYGSNCTVSINETIAADQAFTATASLVSEPACNGANDGEIEVSVSFPPNDPLTTFDYSIDNGVSWITELSNSVIIDTFNAGTHNIQVRLNSTSTCVVTTNSVTLTNPTSVIAEATVTKVIDCNADTSADGATITPTATGGNGNYTYELFTDAALTPPAIPFTDIDTAGTYYVVATDGNNCVSQPFAITVNDKLSVTFDVTPINCYNGTNGTITVSNVIGNGNYTYSLDGGTAQASNIFTGLSDGTYNVTVTDGFGCSETKPVTILPQVNATITKTDATCTDGEITITNPIGGDGNYQYVIVPTSGGTTITSTTSSIDVAAGTYNVFVRDKNGGTGFCEFTQTITIDQIANPTIAVTPTQPNCSGETGSAIVEISNGTANYTTSLTLQTAPATVYTSATSADTIVTFDTLVEGTYDVVTTDANGCVNVATTVTITAPNALAGSSRISQDYLCGQLGEITVESVVGGTAPYTYTLSDGTTSTNHTTSNDNYIFENLTDGTYTVTISDDKGCSLALTSHTINALPTAPTLTSAVTYACDGTGTITITPASAGTYNYTLGGFANTTGVFTGLSSGNYTVSVDYGSSCTVDVTNISVLDNQEFTASITNQKNPTCIGDSNGELEITAVFPSNSPTDFEYSLDGGTNWSPAGVNPFTIASFAAGSNTVLVRPIGATTNCNISLSETLSDPSAITVAASVSKIITCNTDSALDGATISIDGVTSGGNGATYTYALFDNATATAPAVQTGAPFTDIDTAGNYWVVATDAEGCTSAPFPVTVQPLQSFTFNATAQCYDGNDGKVDITITDGSGSYEYSLDGTNWTAESSTSFTIGALSPNTYTVSIRDFNTQCLQTANVTINPTLTANATSTNASCGNLGQIAINPTGGDGNYQYIVTPTAGTPITSTTSPINVSAGTYNVTVRDNNGSAGFCEYIINNIVINQITPVSITAVANQPTCNGDTGSVDGVISDGQAPFEVTITNSANVLVETRSNISGTTYSFNNLSAETYTIQITDALGCTDSQTVTLTDPPALTATLNSILPACGIPFLGNETLFGFEFTSYPTVTPYTIEFSDDNGTTWKTSPIFTSLNSGTIVFPAMRILDTDGITVRCFESLGRYEVPYPVEGLIVNPVASTASCVGGFDVTVEAISGVGPFQFAIGTPTAWEDPDNTSPAPPAPAVAPAQNRTFTFTGLTPGLTYVFYVKDLNGTPLNFTDDCIKQNNEDVYADFTPTVPITSLVDNQSCGIGSPSGQITFDIDNTTGDLSDPFDWTLYKRDASNIGVAVAAYTNQSQTGFGDIVVNGLSSGVYYVILSNNAGAATTCNFGSQDVIIEEGTPITGQLNKINDITCSVDGQVRIENVSGGFGGYSYKVTSITNTTLTTPITIIGNTFNVAHADVKDETLTVDITIEATDVNGCTAILTPDPVKLNISPSPTIDNVTPSSCGTDKTIEIEVSGGTAPYRYSIDGGTTFTAPTNDATYTASGLTAGNYNVVISDANGCEVSNLGATTIQPNLEYTVNLTKNLTCVVGDEATTYDIDITSTGTGPYIYEITGPGIGVVAGTPFSGSEVFSTITPGTYTITITDTAETPNCTTTKTFTVAPAVQPAFTTNVVDAICDGDANGSIEVSVTAGLQDYTYTLSDASGVVATQTQSGNTYTFSGLSADTYTVRVSGSNGCFTEAAGIIVNDNPALVISPPTANQFECQSGNALTNAIITFDTSSMSGGSGMYPTVELFDDNGTVGNLADDTEITTVTVSGSSYEFSINDVTGGSYYIKVTDSQGCEISSAPITINPFTAIADMNIVQTKPIDCSTGDTIEVKTTTNIANVAYEITNGPVGYTLPGVQTVVSDVASATFTNLPTGTYTITSTHPDTGCVFTKEYVVGNEPNYTIIANNPQATCFGANGGSIDISFDASTPFSGATDVYDYEVLDTSGNSLATPITGTGINGGTTVTISNIPAGTYYVAVKMTSTPFCTIDTNEFTIDTPTAAISVTGIATAVTCNGDSDGIITATGADGFGGYTYQLEDSTNAIVAGYDFATNGNNNVFTGLAVGNYTIKVRDVNDCEGTSTSVVVTNPTSVTFDITDTTNACDISTKGSIEVTAAGGTGTYTYILSNAGGVVATQTATIVASATTAVTTFTNLSDDDYTVTVSDSNGCSGTSANPTTVTIHPTIDFDIAVTQAVSCIPGNDAQITISNITGTGGNYTYSFDTGSNGTITSPATSEIVTSLTIGIHNVTVTDVTSGCFITKPITVENPIDPSFTATIVADNICFGSNDGAISVASADTTLTYVINNVANTFTAIPTGLEFTGLPADDYIITATGTNGCTSTTTATINENSVIDISNAVDVSQFGCSTGNITNNATILIDESAITDGSGNYTRVVFVYSPLDGSGDVTQDSNVFEFSTDNISGGNVVITVYDDQGCSPVSTTVTIDAFVPITDATITVDKAIDCSTGENITIKTTPDIAGVTYTIVGTNTAHTQTTTVALATDSAIFNGLPTDDYTITIQNPLGGCELVTYHTVNNEPDFDLVISNIQNISCNGGNDGRADLDISTASPIYTGAYSYTVYTAAGVATTITGNGTGGTTETISGLVAGDYYVEIIMSATPFCTDRSVDFTIASPPNGALGVTAVVNPMVSCTNDSDATITATAIGGWGAYEYQLEDTIGTVIGTNTYSSNNVFTSLPAGNYVIQVRDGSGCNATTSTPVTITNPTPVTFTTVKTDNACDVSLGGSIVVTANGGTTNYTYTLTDSSGNDIETSTVIATAYTFDNLTADTYTINVKDTNGCTATAQTVTINPEIDFSLAETKEIDCTVTPDGEVTVTLTSWVNGTSNYTYTVVGSTDGAVASGNVTANPFTIAVPAGNVAPQNYTVAVTDAGATPVCSVSKTISIEPRTEPDFTATTVVDNICFGTSTGAIKVTSVDNGILPLAYTIVPNVGTYNPATTTFEGLPAGTYTITAQGSNDCTTDVSATVTTNPDIDISGAITTTEFACTTGNVSNNASVSVDTTSIGGTGNFVRAIFVYDNGTPADTSDDITQDSGVFDFSISNQAGGNVSITVFDSNNCSDSHTVSINPFNKITDITIASTKDIDCATGEDIIVTFTDSPANSITNVEYRLYNDTTSTLLETRTVDGDFTTLLAIGDYRIEVENLDTDCVATDFYKVEAPSTYNLVVSNITRACFNGTATADITFSAGTPYTDAYTYEVFAVGNPVAVGNGYSAGGTATVTGLVAGDYYAVAIMTDSPFCTSEPINFSIEQPTSDLTLTGVSTYVDCNVGTGAVLLTANGGWGAFEYQLVNDPTGANTIVQNFGNVTNIENLPAGNYQATVRDANNCTTTFDFTLNAPTSMSADVNVVENNCIGEYNASIVVSNVAGGQTQDSSVRSYTYILIYPDGTQVEQLEDTFNNLPAAAGYQVIVRDNKYSCEYRETVNIVDPTVVVASANITSNITCASNGFATVVVSGSGGTGAYQFSSNGTSYSNNNTFTNVNAGTQTFYVRDANNCVDTVVVTIDAYETLSPTLNVISGLLTCNGDNNGVLSAEVTGGFGNYEYQLLNNSSNAVIVDWQTSNTFDNLIVGDYKINVRSTDSNGIVCTAETLNHLIEQPEILEVAETHTDVTCYSGDDGTITITATGGNLTGYEYNISSDPPNKFITDNVFRNLSVGTYIITVKDKLGCFETIEVEIVQPDEFTTSLVSVTEQDCIEDATPTITLDLQGGLQPYYISINNVELSVPYNTNTIVLGDAENIQAGQSYFITARDSGTNCDTPEPIRLNTAIPVDIQLTVDYEYTCPTGNVIVALVDEQYKGNMSYTLFNGLGTAVSTNNTGEFIDVPEADGYIVTATHKVTNCSQSSTSNPIDIIEYQTLEMTIDDSVKNKLIANPVNGLAPFEYSIDGGEFSSNNEFTILETKNYTITIKDARGCKFSMTVEGVYVSITIINLFTPDGDGINDYWYPKEVESYHDLEVIIFDRYARELGNYKGVVQGWDGTYGGKPLPSGDYWYTVYYKELSGQQRKLMGHFTLYR